MDKNDWSTIVQHCNLESFDKLLKILG